MLRLLLLRIVLAPCVLVGCCGGDASSGGTGSGTDKSGEGKTASSSPTPPATEFVTVHDPVENAYQLDMPKGWLNRAYMARAYDVYTAVDTAVSPDGTVLTFNGDPSLPQYWNPDQATPIHYDMAKVHPKMKIEYYQPAEEYFPAYVQRKFGKLPDFQLVSQGIDQESTDKLNQKFRDAGVNMQGSMARVKFTYTDNGRKMNSLIMGGTCDSGAFWIVTVCGISTTGEPEAYIPMLEAMEETRKMNPDWQMQQQQKHQAQMNQIAEFGRQMTAQHNRNMAWIQQSAQLHQQRMQAIWASNDASVQAFNDRMAAGDVQQQRFLNYINDENTVVTSSGTSMQVDNSYQRYYVNKNNNTYVGGDITMDQDKLRTLGLNPDDYTEAKIKP